MNNHFETRSRFLGVIGSVNGLVIGLVIGALLAVIWFFTTSVDLIRPSRSDNADSIQNKPETLSIKDDFDPTVADSSYSPEEVVRLQLASLQASADHPDRLVICYSLASPENRKITGPLIRFTELVREESYLPLLGHQSAIIGRANLNGNRATVMATVVAENDQTYTFQFFLSRYHPDDSIAGSRIASEAEDVVDERQPGEESSKCWMTDGVYPVLVADIAPAETSSVVE